MHVTFTNDARLSSNIDNLLYIYASNKRKSASPLAPINNNSLTINKSLGLSHAQSVKVRAASVMITRMSFSDNAIRCCYGGGGGGVHSVH